MSVTEDFINGLYSFFPQTKQRFPESFLEEKTTFWEVLNKVTKDSLKPLGLDCTQQTVGTVLEVRPLAQPYIGGFREKINEMSNLPNPLCLQIRVHTPLDQQSAVPTNSLNPGQQEHLIYQSHVYEAINSSLDSTVPNVGDEVMVIHPFSHGFLNPTGIYLGPVHSGIPYVKNASSEPFIQNIKRLSAVPFDEIDPDDECFTNGGQGRNCAWKDGKILGKIDLEEIPTSSAIKYKVRVKPEVARAFKSMVTAASNDSVVVGSVSGFRSYKQQADARSRKQNLAVRPGFSRHQEGIAIDIDVQTTPRTYQWLAENAHKYGFARTVSYEPWHWVYFGIEEATKRRPAYTDVSRG